MKNLKTLSITFAAALAGMALVQLGNSAVLASLPGDKLFALVASLALAGFAIYDYSRRFEPLQVKGLLLRPAAAGAGTPRSAAYGISRHAPTTERTAA